MLSISKNGKDLTKNTQTSKSLFQRIPRKLFSLERYIDDFELNSQPFETQTIYRHDAAIWKWFSEASFDDEDLRLRQLAKLIKLSRRMQELNIEYEYCSVMADTQLYFLAQGLKGLTCLRTLHLCLDKCRQITDKGLYHLSIGLKRLSLLENLKFSFTYYPLKITDKGLHWLSNSIKRFAGLKSLELDFGSCHGISNAGLICLSNSIQNLRTLQRLSLCFSNCEKITDSGIEYLSKKLKTRKGSLKNLSLSFYDGGMSDLALNYLQEALKTLVLLQKVDLKFDSCWNIRTVDFQHLIKEQETLTLLKDLAVCFANCGGITDLDVEYLCKAFEGFRSLEAIKIDFTGAKITDAGIWFLGEIGKNRKTLKAEFSCCSMLTDVGIHNLGLRKLVSLQTLSLSFEKCNKITDLGLENFSRELAYLVLLRNLKLDFGSCSKITDKGFISLCEAFEKLVLLQGFELDLSDCTRITRVGGAKLCESLRKFGRCLKTISWNFDKCDIFGEEELKIFYKNLKQSNSDELLEKLQVRYGGNRLIFLSGNRSIQERICFFAELYRDEESEEQDLEDPEKEEECKKRDEEEKNEKETEVVVEKETERVKMGSEHSEKKNESRSGRLGRLFGWFSKKKSGKQKDSSMMMNNQM